MQETGKWIVLIGFIIVLIGIVWYLFGDKLGFIGNLPGDIKYDNGSFKFYFPFTSMVLLSLLVNVVIRIVKLINT